MIKQNQKLVSVVMPVYNAELYLEEAIESILGQTYRHFEFIIINDGSNDHSLDIILKYAASDDRIRVISRENRGIVNSLNEGIASAKGEYICRMDGDDISKPERIAAQVEFLNTHQDVMLAGCYFDLLVEHGTDYQVLKSVYNVQKASLNFHNETAQHPFLGYVLLHPTWMFRAELVEKIGNYADYRHSEDGEYLFRVLASGEKIGVIEKRLFQYRIFNTSKSGNDRIKNMGIKEDTIRFLLEYLKKEHGAAFTEKYMIWGNDITGQLAHDMIERQFPDAEFLGYIDSFTDGKTEGVFQPEILKKKEDAGSSCGFVFIATHGGMKYAMTYLEQLGWSPVSDYIPVVV